MAEQKELMQADIPDWVRDAEEAIARGETLDVPEVKEISIKFGKGLVGTPFTSRSGKELVEVKIPNADPADKTPWASFVISPKMIGQRRWDRNVRDVPNMELKAMMEAYKTRDRAGDRESVRDSLQEKKEEAARQPEKPKPPHTRSKGMEK